MPELLLKQGTQPMPMWLNGLWRRMNKTNLQQL